MSAARDVIARKPVVCACKDHAFAPMTKGFVTLVSPQDIDFLALYRWSSRVDHRTVYAQRTIRVEGKNKSTTLHREIMAPHRRPGHFVDHVNGDGTDNRRCNLRIATPQQNAANTPFKRPPSSGFHGVKKTPKASTWSANIVINGAFRHIGCFPTAVEAARARDVVAISAFGEFATLNFPLGGKDA